jgi:hypothetical protein
VDLYEGQRYRGPRTFDRLKDFILSKLPRILKSVNPGDWENDESRKQQWLLFLCGDDSNCPEDETRLKMATILVMDCIENVT